MVILTCLTSCGALVVLLSFMSFCLSLFSKKKMSHRFHMDHLDKVIDVALGGCKDIHNILDGVVRRHVANTGAQLGWDTK